LFEPVLKYMIFWECFIYT